MYRCEATTVEGFIQQLAVGYVARGYQFYVVGAIPATKNPRRTDFRIIERYNIGISKFARCRRNRAGIAPIQYIRFGTFFVILAKHGWHPFLREESEIRNIRSRPICFAGYSISSKLGRDQKWHASVRIEQTEFSVLKRQFLALATFASFEVLAMRFAALHFVPYAPIRNQYRILLRKLNQKRQLAGLEKLPVEVLRSHRRIVKPFGPTDNFNGKRDQLVEDSSWLGYEKFAG